MAITGQDLLKRRKQNKTNKSTITGSDLLAARKASGIDQKYIDSFVSDANSFLSSKKTGAASEYDTYTDLSKRSKNISSWLKVNKSKYDEQSVKALTDMLSSFTDSTSAYGQYKDSSDYTRKMSGWLSDGATTTKNTVDLRKGIYNSNAEEIARIEEALPWYEGGNMPDFIENLFMSKSEEELRNQKNRLEAENRQYERTQKAIDDGYIEITPEVLQSASNRDFDNPDRQALATEDAKVREIDDGFRMGRYTYDFSGNVVNAYTNELIYAADDPYVKAMREGGEYSPIADKLGVWINSSQDDRDNAYEILASGVNDYWATAVNDGQRLYWDQLTPDEVTTYYYYLNTEGQDRAYEFLDSLETELGRRATADRAEDIEKASLLEKIALNAASIPQNVLGGVLGAYEDAYNLLYGNEINPYSAAHQMSNDASAIRQSTAKDIDRLTGGAQIPWIEFGFGDAYQALMSGADSIAGGLILGSTTYGVLMGTGAATSTMKDLYERGASGFQIAAGGLLAGAAEEVFEKFSIDNLINLKSAKNISQVFKNALIQGGIEASEETLTEIANAVADGVIMGSESKWTSAEAFAKDVVNAALGGFISGAGMGVGYSAAQNVGYNAQAKSLGEDVINRGEVDALQKLALEMYSAQSGADAKQAVSLSGKIADAKARGKTASATTVGKLADLYAIGKDKQDIETMTKDLTASGLSAAEARKVAEFIARISRGETATPEEISAIEKITNKINIEGLEAEDAASVAPRTIKTTENAPEKEKASEGKISASEPYAVLPSVTDNISEVIGKVGDKYKVRLNDGTELLEDAAEMSPNTERLFATAKDLGLNAESANVFLKSYDGSMSAADYATAYAEAYRYGEYNFAESEMRSDGFSALLSESQRKIAYESGRIDRKYKTEAKQAEIKKTDKKQNKGKLHNSITPTNERQKASLKALGVLAEALGIDIYTFESETNAEGKHVGKNGWYDPKDNSIHIDVYAGAQGYDTILFTAAHELTHMIRRWSPAKFKVFADFLMEKYGEQGKSVSALVRAQMTKAKENGRTLTFDEAYEELVADSCESFLADGDAIAKIAELKAKDKSLWEKIKDYLTKLVARIKAAYEGLVPDSKEGKFVASLLDSAEELRDLWVEAVVDASTAYNEGEIVSIDETSESVTPAFSERTWTQSDYVVHRDEMAKKISEALGVTVAKAKSYIDDINSIAKMIADDRTRLDYEASSFGSAFVSNVEYGGSFDYTTLCKKRRIYTGTFTEIQKRLKDTALSPDDILKIRNLLIEEGVEATCGLCYVEGSRANMGKFAKEFIRLYKRDNPNGWIPNMADVNTPDGVEQMRISHPEVYEQYEYFWNHYGKLKDSDPALFASQQKPKLYEARKEYKGEILEQFSKDTSVAKKNRNGGIRMQSFSDFEIVHLIDTMQVIMDMSTVGLAGQAYTKVPEFALAFGDTGLKINLSLIAKGVDENGKLIFDDREGMPHKTAFDIREKYSKNVGTIIVAFTDEQILAAMADERIDFIIPFHRSQWKKGQYGAMGLPNGTKDYTYQQNEKFIKPTYHEYRGRMVRDKASNYMPNEYWDFSKSGKENAEIYLNMCAEENKRPKFYKFLDYDGNGRYSLKEDGSTDGYWKLLIDFKMYDNDGVGSPQEEVVPSFNMDEATKMLDEYRGGHANYPVAQGVVDKFVREYEGVKYSDRDSSYMDAVNRGDMDTAQRMVDEAAKDWGAITNGNTRAPRPIHLYHGTGAFGFTRFRDGRIYATVEESVASGYNSGRGLGRVRSSSLGYIPNDGTVDTAIKNAKNVLGAELTKLDDAKTQDIISKADNILKEVATKVAELDEVTDYEKAGEFFEYLTEKYGEDKAVQWTNNLDSLHYMLAAEYTAEEIVEDGEWLVHDLERYHEWKQSLSELWLEERDAIKESTLDKVFRYLLGYEYGDALIDIEYGLGRLLDDKQKLVNSNESLIYLDDVIEAIEQVKDTGIYDLYGHPGEKPLIIDEGKRFWDAIPFENGFHSTDYIAKCAKDNGYTSVLFKTVLDPSSGGSANVYADEYVFFDAEQVKSADPVTYDDNGNVIPLSQRFNAEDPDIRFSERDSDTVSNRTLLAEALEGITLNDIEKKKLADYKANAEQLDAAEARLKEVRAEIKDISFSKGTRDKARLSALKEEATQLTNRINIYDRRLINLEATSALKGVLDRAKADVKAREKAKAKADLDAYKERSKAREKESAEAYRESRAANVEGRRKTEMRHKILKVVHDLNKVLENPTKEKHIPIALQKPVAEALAAINMDTVTAEERLAKYDAAIAKAEAEGNTDKVKKLKDTRANIESQGHNLEDKLTRLYALYELLKNSEDPLIKNSYDENIAGLISEVQEKVGDTPIRKMNLAQLNLVYDMFKALKKTISDTNKMFLEAKAEKVSDNASNVVTEILSVAKMKDKEIVGSKPFKKYGWSLLKPTTAMELIGSDTFSSLFANVRAGEETWARDTNEAKTFFQETARKHGYWKWDFKKKYGFVDKNNRRFELTLDQMLSLYAYSKRDQADLHLDVGGFVFDDSIEAIEKKHGLPVKYNIKTQKTYNLTKSELDTIINELADSQKAFVDEMQTYLSETMGDKGNEVSLAMYDIKLFNEKNYFPLKTAQYYREFNPEKKGLPSFKNSGFTKKLTPGANNPVILSNFLDVWSNHVNEMSTYHAFVLPLEDFMRVFNYTDRDGGFESVRAKIVSAYGKSAAEYVENLMIDLNGGARSDYYTGLFSKTFTLFKKSATYLSASVTIQQPSSIARAFAYIDPKYFATNPNTANLSAEWEEMKKYAPVAIIKEMGSFDIGVGRQSAKWITAREYDGFKEKASALVKDADYRDDVLSILPATADKIAWVYIWEAAKKKAATEQRLDGEALLIAAGKIATEAIVNTQVYDSVLTRSGIMRSKDSFTKMLTAFMAEPITTLNMGINGFIQSRRGNPKLAAKMFASVAVANVLNSILVSIVKAARDDDEDQTYGEKYLESLTGEVLEGINILTYLPYIKDAWSLFQGYSVDRPDMTLLDRLIDGITALSSDNKTWVEKARRLAEDLSALFGIPVKNVLRDIDALFNVTKGIIDPPEETEGAGEAMLEGLRSASPKGWYKAKKEEKKSLIQACEDEDFTTAKALIRDEIANAKENGKTESEAKSALRSRMTSYYKPLYIEANEARDAAEMARIRKILARSGLYGKADDVIATTKNWLKK